MSEPKLAVGDGANTFSTSLLPEGGNKIGLVAARTALISESAQLVVKEWLTHSLCHIKGLPHRLNCRSNEDVLLPDSTSGPGRRSGPARTCAGLESDASERDRLIGSVRPAYAGRLPTSRQRRVAVKSRCGTIIFVLQEHAAAGLHAAVTGRSERGGAGLAVFTCSVSMGARCRVAA